ncbi:MAG TPA: tetratricopeptide repeat protein [Blastocatellia bacterium]|jgi:CHAT domain-containing protein|nr:tetratricopeptide repeat protein [Blastocatellia bacterium]
MTRETAPELHLRRVWLAILILSLAFGAHSVVPAQNGTEARLRNLGEKFFASYQKKDLDGLMSIWSQQSPDLAATRQKFQETFARNDKIELKSLEIQRVSVESSKAAMRLVIEMSAIDARTGKPATGFGRLNRTLHFVQEGEEWKLCQYASSEQEFAQALLRVNTEVERTALLEAEKDLLTIDLAQALIAQGRGLGVQGRYPQALIAGQLALSVVERLGDKMGTGRALYYIGSIYESQRDYPRAVEFYQRLLKVSDELGEKAGSASALESIGQIYSLQRDYPQALAYYEKGLKLAEEVGHKRVMASLLKSIGLDAFRQGRYPEALRYYEQGLKHAEEAGDLRQVSVALNNIGIVYDYEGNYARAMEVYQKSLKLKERLDDKTGMSKTLNNLGLIHRLQGNLAQALEYLQASLKLKEGLGAEAKTEIPNALTNIGAVYAAQANYAQALDYHQKSLKLAETLSDKTILAETLGNLGILCGLQGNYSEALEYLQRSLTLNQALGDKAAIATSQNNLGELHFSQGHYAQAAETSDQAAALAKQIDLAEIVRAANTTAGRAYRAINQPVRARQSFLTAINTAEELREQAGGGEQDQQRSFENGLSAYRGMVDLFVDQNNAAEALVYAERAKGRVLLDVLQSGRSNITKAMTQEEQEREREMRAQTVALNVELRETQQQRPDAARLRDLEARLQKARLGYEAFQTGLYAAHPELKVQRGRMQPLTMDQISRLMPDARTALMEFEVLEDKTFLFVLTSKHGTGQGKVDLKVYNLPIKQKELSDLTQRFSESLAERRLSVQESGTRLYELLLKPARVQLQGINSLIIVPDDVLWRLPFQALQPSNSRYLIEDYVISYAPSLTVLREMMRQPAKSNTPKALPILLAFGNPVLGVETIEHARAVLMDERLEPLPEAEKQVKLLGELYGPDQSRIYTGLGAQEERFKAEAGNYRIIHLATHGILNNASPMYSQLVLSTSQTNSNEDGLLEAWEIMKLDLRADLVVLSACETARGRIGAGEGIIGLSWAFFVAGAPTAVVTQWKVESTSSTEMMLEFHKQINNNSRRTGVLDSAAALRQAALKLLRGKQFDHPFYWAPFVVIGNGMGSRAENPVNVVRN